MIINVGGLEPLGPIGVYAYDRVFKHGSKIGHLTRHAQQLFKVKKSKVKVTKSRDVSADKNAITRQCMVI